MKKSEMVDRLHAIAEEFNTAGIRHKDQCALRWSANIVAKERKEDEVL